MQKSKGKVKLLQTGTCLIFDLLCVFEQVKKLLEVFTNLGDYKRNNITLFRSTEHSRSLKVGGFENLQNWHVLGGKLFHISLIHFKILISLTFETFFLTLTAWIYITCSLKRICSEDLSIEE